MMLVIDDAKFPPPKPANAATTMNVVYDESGRFITHSVNSVGTRMKVPATTPPPVHMAPATKQRVFAGTGAGGAR